MKRLLTAFGFLLLTTLGASAQNALPPVSTQLTKFFSGTQSITRAFPAVSGKSIYLTQIAISGTAAGVFTLSTGTGTNCGTSTTTLYTQAIIAGTPISVGDGAGALAVVGSGLDVCITIATQSLSGWVSVAQF
jgi:hypothetical protein